MRELLKRRALAGIEYSGLPGMSLSCRRAVERLLMTGERFELAVVVTAQGRHGLLLRTGIGDWIAIKTGFTSGYSGTGPNEFARTLRLLGAFQVEVEEVEVPPRMLDRLERSALTIADLVIVETGKRIRPSRTYDYIYDIAQVSQDNMPPQAGLPKVMPWGLLDHRLVDLAMGFEENPDHALMTGWRRLEDAVRAKLDKETPESRVFATAFSGLSSQLHWVGLNAGEHTGRGQLFTGAYSAFRNPRAHKELNSPTGELFGQFLLLNFLFQLESTATRRFVVEPE
ncbi:MAG: TIGR02391 family protein [Thiomonas sp.]|nr:TIGR02391 family protein [Thiomonas sp.]